MILVAICTRERPKMLAALLESCVVAFQSANEPVRVLIVENGAPTGAQAVVNAFAHRLDIVYLNETRLGLVRARNTALDHFLAGKAEWLAFLDDDETIAETWLTALLAARSEFGDTKVFFGPTDRVFPETAGKLLRAEPNVTIPHGAVIPHFGSGNCFISRALFSADNADQRFDLAFNMAGAEDTEFFWRLSRRGAIYRFVPAARAFEDVPPERATLRYQLGRWAHQAHCGLVIRRKLQRSVFLWALIVFLILRAFFRGLLRVAAGVVMLPFAEVHGLRTILSGLKLVSMSIGATRIFWRGLGSPYAQVQGA